MHLSKLDILLRAAVALCLVLLIAPLSLGEPSGDARVREAQALLAEQNYRPGPVDGVLGPRTLSAVLRFQIDRGLPPTRELDEVTLETLRAAGDSATQASDEAPRAVAVPPSSPAGPIVSRHREAGTEATDTVEDGNLSEPDGPEPVPAETKAESKNSSQAMGTMQMAKSEPPEVQREVQEMLSRKPPQPVESGSGFLSSEFSIENALFIGLIVFAAVAVIAAIYTSIHGRERRAAAHDAGAEEATVLSSTPEEDLEATVVSPIEPTVTAPPETPVTPPRVAAAYMASSTDVYEKTSAAEDTQAVSTEPFSKPEAPVEAQVSERKEAARNSRSQDDPLADLNIHLAFERFDQAEALVKDAIDRFPERHEYRLRLLEVYTAAKNPLAFEFHARALREAVGEKSPLMATALRWWNSISPERPLFEAPLQEESGGP